MAEQGIVKIAVIGAGPGGLSAAAHAADLGISHVLLESSPAVANTIQKYQKGKHVMAEPDMLPLRSDLTFEASKREKILGDWQSQSEKLGVNIRFGSEVTGISGSKGDFSISLASGEVIRSEFVILGIGMQGNPRRLGVKGDHAEFIQYTLDDPDEYTGENIVVVGAGDAAIENAIALAAKNNVFIVNRRDEFARAKEGNLNLILKAIDDESLTCFYKTTVDHVEITEDGETAGVLHLNTADGATDVKCNRIIARLGAIPPRKFVESCGVEFPSEDMTAIPQLDIHYQSNVEGLYIVGALGGYPLIKQAMNQGYEVVEYIEGKDIRPVDEPLLAEKFKALPYDLSVDEVLARMQKNIPLFANVNALMFREVILSSTLHVLNKGDVIFEKNDYSDSFYTILDGTAEVDLGEQTVSILKGLFFGEMSLISGRRRTATIFAGYKCVLIETPRRVMNKLISSDESVCREIDETFVARAIRSSLAKNADAVELKKLAKKAQINTYKAGDVVFAEGDPGDSLHLIRSGSVTVSREVAGSEIVVSYLSAGKYVGEMGLLGNAPRRATVKAAVATETISLDSDSFNELLATNKSIREEIQELVRERTSQNTRMETNSGSGDVISFLMKQGLGEATDVLLIDESLCVNCDNCEKACAETHGGTSRLDRAAGPSFADIHIPTSCRHCEHPHCMKDCPPDALTRAPNGEVFIQDNCIGCGNCQRNCPYGVIQMTSGNNKKFHLWSWLLTGFGPGPGDEVEKKVPKGKETGFKKAVKCDMCKDLKGGAACVRACPTGAAIRISPEKLMKLV